MNSNLIEKVKNIKSLLNEVFSESFSEEEQREAQKEIYDSLVSKDNGVSFSFQELSENGLVWKINKEVLHPLGLALTRDIDLNISGGCVIAPDLVFEYSKDTEERNRAKFESFLLNRETILKEKL